MHAPATIDASVFEEYNSTTRVRACARAFLFAIDLFLRSLLRDVCATRPEIRGLK